jgi:hypothetical protein
MNDIDDNPAEAAETGPVPSRIYDPWYLPDWTPEQWASWDDDKRKLIQAIAGDVWHFTVKQDKKLLLASDLYLHALS